MLDETIKRLYEHLRLRHYKSLFGLIKEKDGSLSATEAYAADVIFLLKKPTIKQFSDFLGISQPNATYKINCLMAKGYVEKQPSEDDRREYVLNVTEKFSNYMQGETFIRAAVENIRGKFSAAEIAVAEKLIAEIDGTL